MIEKELTCNLEYGLHARPAAYIITALKDLKLDEYIIFHKDQSANLKSILSLLALNVIHGETVRVKISGPDETRAFEAVEKTFLAQEKEFQYSR